MNTQVIETSDGFEDSGFYLMAHIVKLGATAIEAIVQADIDSPLNYTVSEIIDETTSSPVLNGTLEKTDVIFDTLQTAGWSDNTGYNFRWLVPAAAVPDGNKTYRFEIEITPAGGGQPFHVAHERNTADLKRS